MDRIHSTQDFSLHSATQADARIIRKINSQVSNNPLSLDWRRFVLAVDPAGRVIGCGQIKPHADGSFELASIAVVPEWRRNGVARMIVERLLDQHPGRIYLTCQLELGSMYEKFGFIPIEKFDMP